MHICIAVVIGRERGGRKLPHIWRQCQIIFMRSCLKALNSYGMLLLDVVLLIILGLILGATQGYSSSITSIPSNATIVALAFCLANTVTGLRTFGSEYTVFLHRECHGGLITLAYMWGRMLYDLLLMFMYPAIYLVSGRRGGVRMGRRSA